MPGTKLVPVRAHEVPEVWPLAKEHLRKPIELTKGRHSLASVFDSLVNRDAQLWLAADEEILAAMVTQISVYPTGLKVLTALLIGGEKMDRWLPLWSRIEAWGRAEGCVEAEIPSGRKGWTRVLKGWDTTMFMTKEI